jgi:hypothetical protein
MRQTSIVTRLPARRCGQASRGNTRACILATSDQLLGERIAGPFLGNCAASLASTPSRNPPARSSCALGQQRRERRFPLGNFVRAQKAAAEGVWGRRLRNFPAPGSCYRRARRGR